MGLRGRGGGRRMGKVAGRQGGNRKHGGLPGPIRARLQKAREALKAGDADQAVEIFSNLADKAAERGRHGMAVHMGAFATSALARAGRTDEAVAWARKTAQLGGPIQKQAKVARRFGRLVGALRKSGHGDAADAIQAAAIEALGVSRLPEGGGVAVNRARRRMLPKSCPSCGAAVQVDEVEFDEDGADCPACGMGLT